jgi:hypothetical protein
MQQGRLFPVRGFGQPDPECPVAVVESGDAPSGGSFLNLNMVRQGLASCVVVRAAA